jgi:hypothetical protein
VGCNCGSARPEAKPPSRWMVRLPDGTTRPYLSNTEAYAVAGAEYNAVGRATPADAVWPAYD